MLETFRHLAKQEINTNWIVEDLISPGGWTFLVGETKLGKSMLVVQLCAALQEGKPFLGMQTRQHNCLYIQADAGLIEWHEQVKKLAPDSSAWTMHQLDAGFLDIDSERKKLHEIVWGTYTLEVQGEKGYSRYAALEGKQFNFIVFDCLHALTQEDLNTRTSMIKTLRNLDEIVTRRIENEVGESVLERVHYLLIHHPNAVEKRGATAGAGNKGFSALCTTKLSLLPGALMLDGSKLAPKREILLERASNGAWKLPSTYEELDVDF